MRVRGIPSGLHTSHSCSFHSQFLLLCTFAPFCPNFLFLQKCNAVLKNFSFSSSYLSRLTSCRHTFLFNPQGSHSYLQDGVFFFFFFLGGGGGVGWGCGEVGGDLLA